ncbi:unnamed protein product [Rotaria magnacalcarata]|uniref:Uncharacterized protein n=3 Tax=Rotaria magnacalcarata TaxID=392030 RepID=A0A816ZJU3_9BILA|nr:unnamed protein product [Rotaria magnacalcarata]
MADSKRKIDNHSLNANNQTLEIFSLIWLDANTVAKDIQAAEQKLRSVINQLKKFQDVAQCQKYIEERSNNERLLVIVSGRLGREIVPIIHKLRPVISIYVYCMDKKSNEEWASKFSKVKAVVVQFDKLIARIETDFKVHQVVEEPFSINFFSTNTGVGKSTGGINGKFAFYQILMDCLLRLKSTDKDTKELIDCCKQQYEGNSSDMRIIDEFEKNYSPDKALWWYTRQSFFYKTLNAVLRIENIHMIFLFRAYIADIHRLLEKHQDKSPVRVFRCQLMSTDELETLKQNQGQFISINSFFSTSTDYQQALSFFNKSGVKDGLEQVLFNIDADPKMVITKPFANIIAHSEFAHESEVLFMLGAIFRVKRIIRSSEDKLWIIRMGLCHEDEHDLKEVLTDMKKDLGSGETNLRTLGKILWKMGKFDLSEKYFIRLLNELSSNDPLHEDLYQDLADLASQVGDYDKSVQWKKKLWAFRNPNVPSVPVKNDEPTSDMDFGQLSPSYMYSIIFKEILMELEMDDRQSMKEFVVYCRDRGQDVRGELMNFQKEYRHRSPLWWYSQSMPLYGTVNRALRLFDVELLMKVGFFIRDLHHQLENLHREQFTMTREPFTVYRGQVLAENDIGNLIKMKDGLISFNSFFSASKLSFINNVIYYSQRGPK